MGKEFKIKAKLVFDDADLSSIKKKIQSTFGGILPKGGGGGGGAGGDSGSTNLLGIPAGQMSGILKGIGSFGKIGKLASGVVGGMAKAGGMLAGGSGAAGGAAAGAGLGSAVPGIGTAIGAAAGVVIGEVVGPALKQISDQLKDSSPMLAETMALTKTMVNMILKPFADGFAMIMLPIMVWMYKYFILPFYQFVYPAIMKMVDFLSPIAPFLAAGFSVILAMLMVVGGIIAVGLAILLAPMLLSVVILGAIVLGIVWLVENIPGLFGAIVGFLIGLGEKLIEFKTALLMGLVKLSAKIINGIGAFFSWIWSELRGAFNSIVAGVLALPALLGSALDLVIGTVLTKLGNIKDGIVNGITGKLEWLGSFLLAVLNPLGLAMLAVKSVITTVKNTLHDIYTTIKDTVGVGITAMKGFLETIKDTISDVKDALSDLGGGILSIGGGSRFTGGRGGGGGGGGGRGGDFVNFVVNQHLYGQEDPNAAAMMANRKMADQLGMLFR